MAASDLLSAPHEDAGSFSKRFERRSCRYEDLSERFRISERRYVQQYAQIYFCRLNQLAPVLRERARERWGEEAVRE